MSVRANPLLPRVSLTELAILGGGAWLLLTPSGRGMLLNLASGRLPFVPSSTAPGAPGSPTAAFQFAAGSRLDGTPNGGLYGLLVPGISVASGTPLPVTLSLNHIGAGGNFIAGVQAQPLGALPGLPGQVQQSLLGAIGGLLPQLEPGLNVYADNLRVEQSITVNDDGGSWTNYGLDLSFSIASAGVYDVTAYLHDLGGKTLTTTYLSRVNVS